MIDLRSQGLDEFVTLLMSRALCVKYLNVQYHCFDFLYVLANFGTHLASTDKCRTLEAVGTRCRMLGDEQAAAKKTTKTSRTR